MGKRATRIGAVITSVVAILVFSPGPAQAHSPAPTKYFTDWRPVTFIMDRTG
jgi:hypothetical protein